VAVVDEETDPPVVVIRYKTVAEAEWYLGYLREHGGTVTRAKIARGGYGIDAPEHT
jgi:predicted enzyme related to lactoylglutathione lyase